MTAYSFIWRPSAGPHPTPGPLFRLTGPAGCRLTRDDAVFIARFIAGGETSLYRVPAQPTGNPRRVPLKLLPDMTPGDI